MFYTSIFYGSLFCGSAVHILIGLIADSCVLSADRGDRIRCFCSPFQGQIKATSFGSGFFTGKLTQVQCVLKEIRP